MTETNETAEPSGASGGYGMEWMLPELPEFATEREKEIATRFTRVTKSCDEDWPDAHAAWLTVGPQHFSGTVCETREEAGWHCWMFAKAMIAAIDSAASGIPIEGPKVA